MQIKFIDYKQLFSVQAIMKKDQEIPCQICNTPIPIDAKLMIQGVKFSCPNPQCDASYGLAGDSQNIASAAMKSLEELKKLR